MRKRTARPGLSPGTLVHIGERKAERTTITVMEFDESHAEERVLEAPEDCAEYRDRPTVTWLNVSGLHDVDVLQKVGDCFGLHPLVLEDILTTDQRPKMEDYDAYLYIVVKMLYHDDAADEIIAEQVSLVLGQGVVLSFQETEQDVFGAVRERIRNGKGRIRTMGADYLCYALVDAIVDGYFVVVEKLGERIESLEDDAATDPNPATLQRIQEMRNQSLMVHKAVLPLREVIGTLQRGDSPLITSTVSTYLRDVFDHTIHVTDVVDTFRDMAAGLMGLYMSAVSNRMNEIMKVLTIIATVFMPLTFIAGVYGMNFHRMPEIPWRWGYPCALGVMAVVAGWMLVYFRRKRWL